MIDEGFPNLVEDLLETLSIDSMTYPGLSIQSSIQKRFQGMTKNEKLLLNESDYCMMKILTGFILILDIPDH